MLEMGMRIKKEYAENIVSANLYTVFVKNPCTQHKILTTKSYVHLCIYHVPGVKKYLYSHIRRGYTYLNKSFAGKKKKVNFKVTEI